jgi:branched-chain amino acid transport system substrate-binding protein
MGPSDDDEATLIAQDIYVARGLRDVLVISEKDRDGESTADAMRQAAIDRGAPPPSRAVLGVGSADLEAVAMRIQKHPPQALVIWTNDLAATSRLRDVPAAEGEMVYVFEQQVRVHGQIDSTSRGSAGNVWVVAENDEATDARRSFEMRYEQATGGPPGRVASETYDAVMLTARAIETAGPNRARVRDAIAQTREYGGVSGNIAFDREGNDRVSVHLIALGK